MGNASGRVNAAKEGCHDSQLKHCPSQPHHLQVWGNGEVVEAGAGGRERLVDCAPVHDASLARLLYPGPASIITSQQERTAMIRDATSEAKGMFTGQVLSHSRSRGDFVHAHPRQHLSF